MRIVKYLSGGREGKAAMLKCPIAFLPVPAEVHPYLHFRKFQSAAQVLCSPNGSAPLTAANSGERLRFHIVTLQGEFLGPFLAGNLLYLSEY